VLGHARERPQPRRFVERPRALGLLGFPSCAMCRATQSRSMPMRGARSTWRSEAASRRAVCSSALAPRWVVPC
jgi:hypothetical protein